MVEAWRPVSIPSPPASSPSKRTLGSEMNAVKIPIALEPPPTQAATTSGKRPYRLSICSRDSSPMMRWKSRTISGNGAGPATVPSM